MSLRLIKLNGKNQYVVADNDGNFPGVYQGEKAARTAATFSRQELNLVKEECDAREGGSCGIIQYQDLIDLANGKFDDTGY
ncbi:hypothetical protein D3C87_278930 [compost metagenome]